MRRGGCPSADSHFAGIDVIPREQSKTYISTIWFPSNLAVAVRVGRPERAYLLSGLASSSAPKLSTLLQRCLGVIQLRGTANHSI